MSATPETPGREGRRAAWVVAIAGTFLIMAFLAWVLYRATQPEDLAARRARERRQFLLEIRQAEAALEGYAWQDPVRKVVRVPISRAMELVAAEWAQAAAGRTNLIQRVEKATAALPAAPNPYE